MVRQVVSNVLGYKFSPLRAQEGMVFGDVVKHFEAVRLQPILLSPEQTHYESSM